MPEPAQSRADQPPRKGLFVVIDGGEGSGKSTQAAMLVDKLRAAGREALAVRDPGTTHIGEMIRSILLDPANAEMGMRCEMLLYMAARAQMMAQLILPALETGSVVVCDRFVSSTLAYQLGGDSLTADEITAVARVAIKSRWPDRIILLDIPHDAARLKQHKDRVEQRPESYHEMVRRNYLAQARAQPQLWSVIDGTRDSAAIAAEVWEAVRPLLDAR